MRINIFILLFIAFNGHTQIIFSDEGTDFNRPVRDFAVRNPKLDFTIKLYENQSTKNRSKFVHSYRVHWKNDTTILVLLADRFIDSFYMQHNQFYSFDSGPISYGQKGDTLIRKETYVNGKEKIFFLQYFDPKNNILGTANLYESGRIVNKMKYEYTVTDSLIVERAMFADHFEYEYNISLKDGHPMKYVLHSEYNKPIHQLVYKGDLLDEICEYRENQMTYKLVFKYHQKGLNKRKMVAHQKQFSF